MTEFAHRRLNREDAGVHDILRWAFGMEAQEGDAKIMRWPEGRPPQQPKKPALLRLLTALHAVDCASHNTDVRGHRLACDCGALERQTVTGSQPYQADPSRLTALDMIAEAAMIRRRAIGSLRNPHDWTIAAYYIPATPELAPSKRGACEYLGAYLSMDAGHDAGLMTDATWHWAGGGERRMTRRYSGWAAYLGVDKSTVYRWTRGRRGWSAFNTLNGLLAAAQDALSTVFREEA